MSRDMPRIEGENRDIYYITYSRYIMSLQRVITIWFISILCMFYADFHYGISHYYMCHYKELSPWYISMLCMFLWCRSLLYMSWCVSTMVYVYFFGIYHYGISHYYVTMIYYHYGISHYYVCVTTMVTLVTTEVYHGTAVTTGPSTHGYSLPL